MGTAIRYAALALALAGMSGCDDGATATPDDDMGMGGQGGMGGMGGQVGAGGAAAGGEGGAGAAGGTGGAGAAGGQGGAGAGGEGGAGAAGGEGGAGAAGGEGGAGAAGGEGGMGAGGEGGAGAGGEGGMGEGGMGGEGGAPPPAMGDVFSGRITQLALSANPAGDGCRDVTGDGIADNSLAIAAMFANGPLQEQLDGGDLNLMPTSIGLAAPGDNGMFDLALLTGTADGDAYTVQMAALNDDGSPRVVFGGAESMGGDMQAGPGDFPIAVPLGGMELDLNIGDTVVLGEISIDADGLSIQRGVISGVIPNAELVAALEQTEFAFAAGLIFPDVNGVGNSICLTFTSVGATLNGFPVE